MPNCRRARRASSLDILLKPMSVRMRQVLGFRSCLSAAATRASSSEDSPSWPTDHPLGGLRRSFAADPGSQQADASAIRRNQTSIFRRFGCHIPPAGTAVPAPIRPPACQRPQRALPPSHPRAPQPIRPAQSALSAVAIARRPCAREGKTIIRFDGSRHARSLCACTLCACIPGSKFQS